VDFLNESSSKRLSPLQMDVIYKKNKFTTQKSGIGAGTLIKTASGSFCLGFSKQEPCNSDNAVVFLLVLELPQLHAVVQHTF
jgi:hypothetical protein